MNHSTTIQTYNAAAQAYAAYFTELGVRTEDIDRALALAQADPANARVVELGCGDGRDAGYWVTHSAFYEACDPSESFLAITRQNLPTTSFVLADALSYDYPENLDVIYAAASLLHCDQHEVASVFRKAAQALRPGGIFYISLKEAPEYTEHIKKDAHGERLFYLYTPTLVTELAGEAFSLVYEDHQQAHNATAWFTLALQRR